MLHNIQMQWAQRAHWFQWGCEEMPSRPHPDAAYYLSDCWVVLYPLQQHVCCWLWLGWGYRISAMHPSFVSSFFHPSLEYTLCPMSVAFWLSRQIIHWRRRRHDPKGCWRLHRRMQASIWCCSSEACDSPQRRCYELSIERFSLCGLTWLLV